MPETLKMFVGFVIGFGLWEASSFWLGDDPFVLGAFAADVLGPAAIATALLWAYERWRARQAPAG